MKKLLLILFVALAATSCDDNYKRDTPSAIEFTIWTSTNMSEIEIEEQRHLKFYNSTFDLVSRKFDRGELLGTLTQSGAFTYRKPKVTLFMPDGSAINGMITGRVMLLENNLLLELTDSSDAF